MKKLNLIKKWMLICTAFTAVAFVGCGNDESIVCNNDGEIRFSTSVSSAKSGSINVQIPKDQNIGISITEDAATPTTVYNKNLVYAADGTGNLTGESQRFPTNGNSVRISAYHPYSTSTTDNYVFSVQQNQIADADTYTSDLLFCSEFVQAPTTAQIALSFKHKLSLITYNLTAGDGNPDLTNAQVNAVNVATSIAFDRKTGDVESPSNLTNVSFGSQGGIVVPQNISAGTRLLAIKLSSGEVLYYTTSEALILESGKKYNFSLKVNQAGETKAIINTATRIEDWETGLIINGEANENNKKITKWVAIGNSITSHGLAKYWWGEWGMAASKRENDYVHVLNRLLENKYGSGISFNIINSVSWEQKYQEYDERLIAEQIKGDEDLIIVNLGENVPLDNGTPQSSPLFAVFENEFNTLISLVKGKNPTATLVVAGNFYDWRDKQEGILRKVAIANSCKFVQLNQLYTKENTSAIGNIVWGADGKEHTIENESVARHPGDTGMRNIAELLFQAIAKD